MVRVAVDAMGGDHGLFVTIPATLEFANSHPESVLVLVGRQDQIQEALASANVPYRAEQIKVVHAEEVVGMDEPPAQALRNRRQSSMRIAAELVKAGEADAVVSAGNTGALMAISRYVLKTIPGIDRPAIASGIPNSTGHLTWMLDLGANVECEAEHLLQFAAMGAALASVMDQTENPSIGLLNVGEELIKGSDVVKEAAERLRGSRLNFFGNVEGDDIYKGTVDVVVCDGFVGNVALKASEGLAQMLGGFIKREFTSSWLSKLGALASYGVLKRFRDRFDHRRYNGASLLGLRGIVIKSHGGADAFAFGFALRRGYDAAQRGLPQRIEEAMSRLGDTPAPGPFAENTT